MKTMIDQEQTVELHVAVDSRIRELKSARTYLETRGLSTVDIDGKLLILRGDDATSGLKELLHEQITMFETGKFGDLEQVTLDLTPREREAEPEEPEEPESDDGEPADDEELDEGEGEEPGDPNLE